jgi:HK97 family phage major capsid protein
MPTNQSSVRDQISSILYDYVRDIDKIRTPASPQGSLSRVFDELQRSRTVNPSGYTPPPGRQWFPPSDTGLYDGLEHELCVEAARQSGESYSPRQPIIPWSMLATRDLTAASASSGGYLTSTDVGTPLQVLAPFSVVARLATVLFGLTSDVSLPVTTAEPTPEWMPTEGTVANASTPTLKALSLTPHTVIAIVQYSYQLKMQAGALDEYLRRLLLSAIGRALDVAVLRGSGANGEINGLVNNPDVTALAGAALDLDKLLTAQETAANADADDASIAALTTPSVRRLLAKREAVSGNAGMLWRGGRCADVPAYVTTSMPAATMLVGDFANLIVGVFGAGVAIDVNVGGKTSADFMFQRGETQVRAMLMCDANARTPSSFTVASSIT